MVVLCKPLSGDMAKLLRREECDPDGLVVDCIDEAAGSTTLFTTCLVLKGLNVSFI